MFPLQNNRIAIKPKQSFTKTITQVAMSANLQFFRDGVINVNLDFQDQNNVSVANDQVKVPLNALQNFSDEGLINAVFAIKELGISKAPITTS